MVHPALTSDCSIKEAFNSFTRLGMDSQRRLLITQLVVVYQVVRLDFEEVYYESRSIAVQRSTQNFK